MMKCLFVVGSAVLIGSASAFAPNVGVVGRVQSPTRRCAVEALAGLELGLSQEVIVAGGAALAGIVFAMGAGGDKGTAMAEPKTVTVAEPKAEPVDVSIPYDAAARLAFSAMNGKSGDEATFQKFQDMYVTKAVAQVTAKKVARDAVLEAERFASIAAQAEKDMASLV